MRKKFFVLIILISGVLLFSQKKTTYPLGDLGKPDNYDLTIQKVVPELRGVDKERGRLPSYFNWKDLGKVTWVKNQGHCGSCWAFACVGAFESKLMIIGEPQLDLSEQQLVSCDASGQGCKGGTSLSLMYWYFSGPMKESCTSYWGVEKPCSDYNHCKRLFYATAGYYTVNIFDQNQIKASLYNDGPAYFRFDVFTDFHDFWSHGKPGQVYKHSSGSWRGGHAVLIIGWSDSKGAWLCKNSWGYGGPNDDGTFWIAYSGHAHNLFFGMANVKVFRTYGFNVTGGWTPSPGYAVGYGINYKSGDFNGDGKTDLVHCVGSYIHTWLSKGDGTFNVTGGWTPSPGYVIGDGSHFKSGDFNGDGKTDLVHFVGSYIHTWLSKGDGTFTVTGGWTPSPGYVVGYGGEFKSGDFNGDGKTDLIHFVGTYIHTWLSKGDGTFTVTGGWTPSPGYVIGNGGHFQSGDFNKEGKTDLIHFVGTYIHTWLSKGNGTFNVNGGWTPSPGYAVGWGGEFKSGDFNGDGKTDLVHFVGSYIHTWLSKGDGTFTVTGGWTPAPGYVVGHGAEFKSGDFNGDGKTDLVHFVGSYIHAWLSKGDGTFTVWGGWSPAPGYGIGNGASFKSGDINGDGKTDLVHFCGTYIHVWFGRHENEQMSNDEK